MTNLKKYSLIAGCLLLLVFAYAPFVPLWIADLCQPRRQMLFTIGQCAMFGASMLLFGLLILVKSNVARAIMFVASIGLLLCAFSRDGEIWLDPGQTEAVIHYHEKYSDGEFNLGEN